MKNKIMKQILWIIIFFVIGYCFFYWIPGSIEKNDKLNQHTNIWQKFKKRLLDEDLPIRNLNSGEIDMSDIGSKSFIGKDVPYRIEKSQEGYSKDARKELDSILEKTE